MAVSKLSAIASSGANPVAADTFIGVHSGTTDFQFTFAQVLAGLIGGSTTQVQFNSSGSFSGDSGFTYAGSGQATLALGSISANAKALNITGTWNNAAVVFDAPLFMNITNTASAGGSQVLDLQVGSSSIFTVAPDGSLNIGKGAGSNVIFALYGNTASNLATGNWSMRFLDVGTPGITIANGVFGIGPSAGAGADIQLSRSATGTFAVHHGVNPAALQVYNTTDTTSGAPTNFERGGFDWLTTASTFRIRSEKGGTGTVRIIAIDSFQKAGAAAATDLPASTWALVRDTSGATTKLVYNNAGTLMTVALA